MRTILATILLAFCILPAFAQSKGNRLNAGQHLTSGQYLVSTEEPKSYAIMQNDGNFCFYRGASPAASKGKLWCSGTTRAKGAYYLEMKKDANLCLYRGTGPADNQGGIWCSQSTRKPEGAYFLMAGAKKLQIWGPAPAGGAAAPQGAPVWQMP